MAKQDTFKFLKNVQGDAYAYGEGITPGGSAYPQTIKPGTEKSVYTPNEYDYGSDIWHHRSAGASSFADAWDSSKYAQQIKAKGPINSEYDEKFAQLTKSDSIVDDEGDWVTLKSRRNNEAGTKEEFEALANEWREAGYDVRVHDLDGSTGAKWADIAVRKGPGGKTETTGEMEDPKPIEHSPEIKQAKERVKAYEQDVESGKTSYEIFGKGEELANLPEPKITDKYKFDASLGAAGIGGSPDNSDTQAKAAASFLDNKLTNAKKMLSLNLQ